MDRSDAQALGKLCHARWHEDFRLQHFDIVTRHYHHKQLEWACRDTFQEDFRIPPFDLEVSDSGRESSINATQAVAHHPEHNTVEPRKQTTLLTIPIELRFIIYEYMLSTVRVNPTVTTTQLPLLQICHLVRHEAKTIYFARLDQIDREASKLHRQKVARFEQEENGEDFSVTGHVIQSMLQRDDVLALTQELRWISFGAMETDEVEEARDCEKEDGVECANVGGAAKGVVWVWVAGLGMGWAALLAQIILG